MTQPTTADIIDRLRHLAAQVRPSTVSWCRAELLELVRELESHRQNRETEGCPQ